MTFSSYAILAHKHFDKSLRKNLPSQLHDAFKRKLGYLKTNPMHPSLNTKQLTVSVQRLNDLGVNEAWEFRINMGYRCVFCVDHSMKVIIITFVGDHEEVKRFCR